MNEAAAREVTALKAIETTDRERTLWSEADREWATRAAAEVVGASASADAFLSRRAALAIERIGERHAALPRALQAFAWRPAIAPLIVAVAFVAGIAADRIGDSGRVNILAPPVLGLLAWNVAVYVLLVVRWLTGWARTGRDRPGPLRQALARAAARGSAALAARRRNAPLAASLAAFASDWSQLALPIYAARAARILHLAAIAFAAGVIAGMYLRGLAFEYLASWQSTFLDAAQVHAIVARVLSPGAALTGIAVPDVEAIAALRDNPGNAARWLHLYAATVLVVVIVPRFALALVDGLIERRRSGRVGIDLGDGYFRRLLRGFGGAPPRLLVVPYSFTPGQESIDGLQAIARRAFGPRNEIVVAAPLAYGGEDALRDDLADAAVTSIAALFNATATPEGASHGTFLSKLAAAAGSRDVFAIVDETAFRARFAGDEARLEARRAAWRELFTGVRARAVFAHLAEPDLESAEAALDDALDRVNR